MAEQVVSELTPSDSIRLDQQRAVVTRYLDKESLQKFSTAAGKLQTLQMIMRAGIFAYSQPYELQSMGIVLGDAFVQEMGFHWIMVDDGCGRDPAIQYEDTSLVMFPLTMISKRVERGEAVDILDLYDRVSESVRETIEQEPLI